jgi:multicomponent Na+:H+ antiporter subunit D
MPEAVWLPAAILVPLGAAVLAAFLPGRWAAWLTLVGSTATLGIAILLLRTALASGPLIYALGGWAAPYGITLVGDVLGTLLTVLSALIATAAALYTLFGGGAFAEQRLYHSFFLLMLMSLAGVFLTGDLFNLYVFMELAILSSLPLVAMARRPVSAEAAFKYAVLSALGSTLLLVSVAMVYAGVGTLNMADIARRVHQGAAGPLMEVAAAIFFFVFLLKAAVFPVHFWQPDAHSAAPAPISAMLSGVLVKVGIYGIVRLEQLLLPGAAVLDLLVPIGAVAALFGGLAALANRDLKRLLAYSTISNMGLIVLALGWGGTLGLTAGLVHVVNHAMVKATLFLAGGYVAERVDEHRMARLGGVAALSPAAATAFGVAGLGIAGLPPIAGFTSKLALLQAGTAAGSWIGLTALVAASALGLAYPLRAFLEVFWGRGSSELTERWRDGNVHAAATLAPLLLAALILLLGLWPQPLFTLVSAAVAEIEHPARYIESVLADGG